VTVRPPAYDPTGAKKLLVEAGYPNGFEIELGTIPLGHDAATAISGNLQAVGIKARINQITVAADRTVRPSGKTPLYIGTWPGQALADAHLYTQLFMERDVMDFSRDPIMTKAGQDGLFELDEGKREKIYETLFNRMNEQAYLLNLMTMDTAYLHSADVVVQAGRAANTYSARLQDFSWTK
jgi:peptide/nickel transport system substrate-binding protein